MIGRVCALAEESNHGLDQQRLTEGERTQDERREGERTLTKKGYKKRHRQRVNLVRYVLFSRYQSAFEETKSN